MSAHPHVLVSGYYGFGNAGDEAILAGLVESFRLLSPQAQLTVLSGNPGQTEAEHGVAAAPRGFGSARRCLQQADLLISGGGGLLQDATSWRSPLHYLRIMRLARAAGVPVACIGQGIGPLRRSWVRWLVRKEVSQVELIAVRDRASADVLRTLGVPRSAEVTADLGFALPRPTQQETAAAWVKAGLKEIPRPVLGIALRPPVRGNTVALAAGLAWVIGLTCRQFGLHPVLVPLHYLRDLAFAKHVEVGLATAFGMDFRSSTVQQRLTARELLALAAGFDLLLAMRLHALIFAAICGVPPVAVSYDPKVDALMANLGLEVAASTDQLNQEALARSAARAWLTREQLARALAAHPAQLQQAALRNVELALPLAKRRA